MNDSEKKFRQAEEKDIPEIWEILQGAIQRRREEGSAQWQNGYPNLEIATADVQNGQCYLLEIDGKIAATSVLMINDEPAYKNIDGKWLSDGDFLVIHRVAVSEEFAGKGVVKQMFSYFEDFAKSKNIFSIKVDTNFDNAAMLAILQKLNYTYCGEVYLAGGKRKAFEKLL